MLQRLRAPGWAGHGLGLGLGALGVFGFAPYGFWPALVLSGLALLWLLDGLAPRAAFARAFCWGLGFYGFGVHWVHVSIHVFGQAPWILAAGFVLLLAAYMALYAGLAGWVLARWFPAGAARHLLAFPVLWLVQEAWRGWFLTGFPWLFWGYSQMDGPLAGYAPVLGVYGVSLVLALWIGCFYLGMGRRRWALVALAVALPAGGVLLERIDWVSAKGEPVSVALVQGNVPQEVKWNPDSLGPTVETYVGLTAPHWGKDLVVWPEAALPAFREQLAPMLEELSARAKREGTALVMGLPTAERTERRYHNSIVAYGTGSGEYHKQHLVPFGEYVPLEGLLRGLIGFFDLPMSAFSAGESGLLLDAGKLTLNPAVCYEIAYPVQVAELDADALLTVSNDAWFGASIGPDQHLEIARMRALENGRWLLRATNNGITAIVDDQGRITARLPQFERGVLTGELRAMAGQTPFVRFGVWPLAALAAALAWVAWRRR